MPFSYYARLSAQKRRIYDASARVGAVPLRSPEGVRARVPALAEALEREDRAAVGRAASALVAALCDDLAVPRPEVRVRSKRPQSRWGELHGLYTREEGKRALIEVWMRTAAHKRVVAFRAFLRTLLHEVLHHLDYEHLKLADSLHTEGFYQRESSLAHQLLDGAADDPPARAPRRPAPRAASEVAPEPSTAAPPAPPPAPSAMPSPTTAPQGQLAFDFAAPAAATDPRGPAA